MEINFYDWIILALDWLNLVFGVILLIVILLISRNFEGLSKMKRPWNILMYSMAFYLMHYVTILETKYITTNEVHPFFSLLFSALLSGFLILLLYGLYSLFSVWRPSKD